MQHAALNLPVEGKVFEIRNVFFITPAAVASKLKLCQHWPRILYFQQVPSPADPSTQPACANGHPLGSDTSPDTQWEFSKQPQET